MRYLGGLGPGAAPELAPLGAASEGPPARGGTARLIGLTNTAAARQGGRGGRDTRALVARNHSLALLPALPPSLPCALTNSRIYSVPPPPPHSTSAHSTHILWVQRWRQRTRAGRLSTEGPGVRLCRDCIQRKGRDGVEWRTFSVPSSPWPRS